MQRKSIQCHENCKNNTFTVAFDFAIQHCGTAEAAFEVARLNNMSLTQDVEPDTELILPEISDKDVVLHIKVNKLHPGTGITQTEFETMTNGGSGIEFWRIEQEFEVN